MRLRLSDADRERFGCDEWLDVDLSHTTNREAATVQKVLGFDSVDDIAQAWADQWRSDPAGGDDEPTVTLKRDYDAWDAVVWLTLRRAGVLSAKTRDELAAELDGLEYEVVRVALGAADPQVGKETASESTPPTTSTG